MSDGQRQILSSGAHSDIQHAVVASTDVHKLGRSTQSGRLPVGHNSHRSESHSSASNRSSSGTYRRDVVLGIPSTPAHIALGFPNPGPSPTGGHMTDSAAAVSSKSPEDGPPQDGGISEEAVDRTRAWTGLYVVIGGDVAIAAAAVVALFKFAHTTVNASSAVLASILSTAFATIGTMTTAYFGIRASSSTAQRSIKHHPGGSDRGSAPAPDDTGSHS